MIRETIMALENREAGSDGTDTVDVSWDDDAESPPPPLPADSLAELCNVLTAYNSAAGSYHAPPWPAVFCLNCTRPLPTTSSAHDPCPACGHEPERSAELLPGDAAWQAAYAAQLAAQQVADEAAAMTQQQGQSGDTVGSGVLLAYDPSMLLHRMSLPPHPERPERISAIMARLHRTGLMARCRLLACQPAADEQLLTVHSQRLVDMLDCMEAMGTAAVASADRASASNSASSSSSSEASCCSSAATVNSLDFAASSSSMEAGAGNGTVTAASAAASGSCLQALHPDTLFSSATATAARRAAGAACLIGAALAQGRARHALAVVRPPGAQAGRDAPRGGCLLNNVALAVQAARAAGARRVLVVDWDVHHGRGTQQVFGSDPDVLHVSMHRYEDEMYPGSGAVEDVGAGAGAGRSINVAFASGGLGNGDLLAAMLHVVLPVGYEFRPDVVMVAAGFGFLKGDPLGGCSASPAVFAHMTHQLLALAPVGLLLEGGYNLAATAQAVEGCLRALLGDRLPPLESAAETSSTGCVGTMNAMQIHSKFWRSVQLLSFNGWMQVIRAQESQRGAGEHGDDSHDDDAEEHDGGGRLAYGGGSDDDEEPDGLFQGRSRAGGQAQW